MEYKKSTFCNTQCCSRKLENGIKRQNLMKMGIYGNMKKCGHKIYLTFKFLQGMSDEPLKVLTIISL